MKILMINSYYAPNFHGGADVSVQILAEGLVDAGHEVVVVTLARGLKDDIACINGVTVYYLAVNNRMSHIRNTNQTALGKAVWQIASALNPAMPFRLKQVFSQEKPNIVHTHIVAGFSTKPWIVARDMGIATAHTLHDYYLLCPRGIMFRGKSACEQPCWDCRHVTRWRRQNTQRLHALISVSERTLHIHTQRDRLRRVPLQFTLYNSVPVARLVPKTRAAEAPLRLGFLGRLEPFKGVELLLKAVSRMPRNTVELKIGGVGSGRYTNQLLRRWSSPNVAFLGLVESSEFLNEIDVLVIPSLYHDPAPRVVLEALAHGVPVLGSRLGGMSELFEHGSSGWICDASSPEGLFEAISQLVDSDEPSLETINACLARAEKFPRQLLVERHLQLYEQICTPQD